MKKKMAFILVVLTVSMAVIQAFALPTCGCCGSGTRAKYGTWEDDGSMYHEYGTKYDSASGRNRPVIYYCYPQKRQVTLICIENSSHTDTYTQYRVKKDWCWNE